jgi:hypothetical protein
MCFTIKILLDQYRYVYLENLTIPKVYGVVFWFETIWSSIFDLNTLKMYRAEGDPRRKKFIEDNRLILS